MSLGYGILGFLSYGTMSGYDLVKAFGSSLEFFWHAQNSHIYLELKKLEQKGYISGEVVVQSDRPNKRLYSITKEGRKSFLDWLAEGPGEEATQFKSAFLMKVFFGGNLTPAQSIEMIGKFKRDCEEYLEQMASVPGSIEYYGTGKEAYQSLYWELTADFGYRYIKMCIDWAKDSMKRLENCQKKGD